MAVAILALQVADEFLHVIDVVVQVEFTFSHRHDAGISPVGDVNLVIFEHGAHRVAQQRSVVARQGSHDQHGRLVLELGQRGRIIREALEATQFAKGFVDLYALMDRNGNPVHVDRLNTKNGLFIVFAEAVNQVITSGYPLRQWVLTHRGQLIAENLGRSLGEIGKRLHERALRFVDLVQHVSSPYQKLLQCNNITAVWVICWSDFTNSAELVTDGSTRKTTYR